MNSKLRNGIIGGLVVLLGATGLMVSCAEGPTTPTDPTDPGAGGVTGISLSVMAITTGSTTTTVLNWVPGSDDGYGALDAFLATATDSIAQTDSLRVDDLIRTASFTFGPWAANTVVSGAACVRAERRGLSSAFVCTGWSASVDDVAPPAPIMDSVQVYQLHDSLAVVGFYRLATAGDDGNGLYTLALSAKDYSGVDSGSVSVPTAPGSQAVILTGYTYGQTYTGQICVTATRRALFSQACASFTGIILDRPPPPPILPTDSFVALEIYPRSANLVAMFPTCSAVPEKSDVNGYPVPACITTTSTGLTLAAVQTFCGMLKKNNGYYYILSGQQNVAYCQAQYDSLPAGTKLEGYPVATQFIPTGQAPQSLAKMAVKTPKIRVLHSWGWEEVTLTLKDFRWMVEPKIVRGQG